MNTTDIGQFKLFLTKKRLWSEFKREYYKKGNNPSANINTTLNQVGKELAVKGVITWSSSSRGYNEGVKLWGDVSREWEAIVKEERAKLTEC